VRIFWPRADSTELVSPLPLEDCVHLLRGAVEPAWKLFGRCPVVGWARGTRFSMRKRVRYSNSLQTLLLGSVVAEAGRTRIRCRFTVHPWATALLVVWFGAVGVLAIVMVAVAISMMTSSGLRPQVLGQDAPVAGPVLALATAPALLVLAYLLVRFGRWLARGERGYLIDYVCLTLEAKPAAAPAPVRERVG